MKIVFKFDILYEFFETHFAFFSLYTLRSHRYTTYKLIFYFLIEFLIENLIDETVVEIDRSTLSLQTRKNRP